ncbi:3-hydroxybutyryl-CoA dehydrogenase [Porphyridium purpureum]|uniref:3-hydroxybutyryl-CoA dehydrogenase n=1 Tax=Porphyridium purpureum TaxID=35688 RepID=A0A5J4YMS3_PORPP|nr:3-hydroxybutyryl-CoA dehydrogenase [Porphyridium purpureum]|eukprot:POR8154..scf222_8
MFESHQKEVFRMTQGIRSVAVLGCGQMGTGIAQCIARDARRNVFLHDSDQKQLVRALQKLNAWAELQVSRNKWTEEEAGTFLKRIIAAGSLKDVDQTDFVIEATVEDFQEKSKLFKTTCEFLKDKPEVIIATNTSSLSITRLAETTDRPSRFCGMHFFNPVPVMKVVELVRGAQSTQETVETTASMAQIMGKSVAFVQDSPGFVSNRLLMPYINEAALAVHEGLASVADIDHIMREGCRMPMGPLELADFIGLDTCLAIMRTLGELGETKFAVAPSIVELVKERKLGKKTGQGFYAYTPDSIEYPLGHR